MCGLGSESVYMGCVVCVWGVFVAVSADSLNAQTLVADGNAKRIELSGHKLDESRDEFQIVARNEGCNSGTPVGTVSVVAAGGPDTELQLDVSVAAGSVSAGATEFKLCMRLGSDASLEFYDMSSAGANHLAIVKATGFSPLVLPVGVGVGQPLTSVLTVQGAGLLDGNDEFLVVASGVDCEENTLTGLAGVSLSWVSRIAGVEEVYSVTTETASAGAFKLCHKPSGAAEVWYGEVEGSPEGELVSATGVSPSLVVADGTVKVLTVSGAGLDKDRDEVRIVRRSEACSNGATVGTATVDTDGPTDTSVEVEVTMSGAEADGETEFKMCIRYGSGAADRWFDFGAAANDNDLNVVGVSAVVPLVLPVQTASVMLTVRGSGLSGSDDTVTVVETSVNCQGSGPLPAPPGDTAPVLTFDGSAAGESTFSVDTSHADLVPGEWKLCLRPDGGEYGDLATITIGELPLFVSLWCLCVIVWLCGCLFVCGRGVAFSLPCD